MTTETQRSALDALDRLIKNIEGYGAFDNGECQSDIDIAAIRKALTPPAVAETPVLYKAFTSAIDDKGYFENADGVRYKLFSAKQVRDIKSLLTASPAVAAQGVTDEVLCDDMVINSIQSSLEECQANDDSYIVAYKINRMFVSNGWIVIKKAATAPNACAGKGE